MLASGRSTLIITGTSEFAPKESPSMHLDEAAQSAYLAKARELLGLGQIAAARLVLQRAADAGNAEAALNLGDTYDPLRLFEMGTRGIVGDLEKAEFWYEKADELGSAEAKGENQRPCARIGSNFFQLTHPNSATSKYDSTLIFGPDCSANDYQLRERQRP